MPDTRPDMRQRALFVTSNAACRWNKMLLAELKADIPRAAIVVATESGKDPGRGRKSAESVEGGMDCQSF